VNLHPLAVLIVILFVFLAVVAARFAILDARADRAHQRWLRRNELHRRRTQVAVKGIRYGYRGAGLDGQADHPDALRKNTRP